MNLFTPGPWKVNEVWGTIEAMGDREICAIHAAEGGGGVSRFNRESCQANAALIAAAPEMLEALQYLIQGRPGEAQFDRLYETRVNAARQAIAKARGEA
jgi:hypothetical protein